MAKKRQGIGLDYILALVWALGLTLLVGWLGWYLYTQQQLAGRQVLTTGQAMVLSLSQDNSADELPATGLDSSAFPGALPPAAPPPLQIKEGQSLKAAPDPELTENDEYGPLPKISANGAKPWLAYAHPFKRAGSAPIIAIFITGVGMNKEASDAALRLPPEITLGISPCARQTQLWARAGRAMGREIMVDLPLEPVDASVDDPGPHALLGANKDEDNMRRLRWVLTRVPGIIGVDLSMGERFSSSPVAANAIYHFIASRGLLMAIAPGGPTEAQDVLLAQAVQPFVRADLRLDDVLQEQEIGHQLSTLENLARTRGYAFGMGHAYPITLKTLDAWQQALGKKGIILAPVSALARMNFS